MTEQLVGVDIGTTRLKVGVFTPDGRPVAVSQRDCPPDHEPAGRVTLAPENWWRAFEEALDECLAQADRGAVAAMTISSQAQTYVFLDADSRTLGPAVSWLDDTGDAEGTVAALAGMDYYAHTGWAQPNGMLTATKLRRQFHEEPGLGQRVHGLLFPDGYLAHRLTGRTGVGATLAGMSGLYSIEDGDWWPDALRAAGISSSILPPVRAMGEPFGQLTAPLAERFGLPRIPVAAGTNDQTAAALGAGLTKAGQAALGMGTALVLYQVVDAATPPPPGRPLRGRYAGGLRWQLLVHSTAGAVMDWARRTFGTGCDWQMFFSAALSAPAGSEGLRLDPDWTDSAPGGVLNGLRLGHTRGHVFRAVLEGVACAAREQLDALNVQSPIKATGGGSTEGGWMQLLADFTGRPIEQLSDPHAGLWGTALLGGTAVGVFHDSLSAAQAARPQTTRFTPRTEHAAAYDTVYTDYRTRRT